MDFMRDLKECQAEVFRRSEEKIKARRKTRNRILAACIPLFLTISIWSMDVCPERVTDDPVDVQADSLTDTANSLTLDYATAEIQEDNSSHTADSSRTMGYDITLTDSEGKRILYHLNGNLLTNTETNETVILTEEELLQLKAYLGIPD